MRKYMKFVNALLFLGSAICVCLPFLKVSIESMTGMDLLRVAFFEADDKSWMQNAVASGMEDLAVLIVIILAILGVSLIGVLLSLLLKGVAVYIVDIIFALINLACVGLTYYVFYYAVRQINAYSLGLAEAEVGHVTFILWMLLEFAIFVLSIVALASKNKVETQTKGTILPEEFSGRNPWDNEMVKGITEDRPPVQKPPVQKQPVQKPPVQKPPVQKTPVQKTPVQRPPMQKPPVQKPPVQKAPADTLPMQDKNAEGFSGAIVGKGGQYAGKAFPLEDKYEVFFVEEENGVNISVYEEEKAAAGIYYVSEYQEYCVDVKEVKKVYLSSGQPLGAGREYYLPRGTEIYINDKSNLFMLA